MERLTYRGKRYYVASVGTWSFVFESYWLPDTFGIGFDALGAGKSAGIPASYEDWDDLIIEGPYLFQWQAKRAMRNLAEFDGIAAGEQPGEPEELPEAAVPDDAGPLEPDELEPDGAVWEYGFDGARDWGREYAFGDEGEFPEGAGGVDQLGMTEVMEPVQLNGATEVMEPVRLDDVAEDADPFQATEGAIHVVEAAPIEEVVFFEESVGGEAVEVPLEPEVPEVPLEPEEFLAEEPLAGDLESGEAETEGHDGVYDGDEGDEGDDEMVPIGRHGVVRSSIRGDGEPEKEGIGRHHR